MAADAHVSTGRLPTAEEVQAWVDDAHAHFAADASGDVSRVYPALAEVPADLFGICVVSTSGGVNPVTGERVIDAAVCHYTLAVMLTAGLYETSGDWLYDVGLPAKSGIGGGIVTISPGKGGMGTFAPRLDAAGNSVKGRLVAEYLSRRLGLDLLISDSGVNG
jgi:glutaminase